MNADADLEREKAAWLPANLEAGGAKVEFIPGFQAQARPQSSALGFAFKGGKLLVCVDQGQPRIPVLQEVPSLDAGSAWVHFFGSRDGVACYAVCLPDDSGVDGRLEPRGLRELFGRMDEDLVWVAGRAGQLVHWHRNHRFCGRCGGPTEDHRPERAKFCPACGLINHPRVSPAIIVAVVKERQLLLAHAHRFPARFYSVLAGFAEPGETLEECVQREVFEEVGVQVKNIRYFGSQPWPFPDSLMVAFTAEYAGGQIRVNPAEISEAGWFAAAELPEIPPPISIARRLIDWFCTNFR
ncbi:MAG: NAD(+) diphosphatase [Desulfobacterales bacterium]|jgi:NAD+ diphosphatase|nr:NAD(+) diphosphatase [Desulfobacterales bacterium]